MKDRAKLAGAIPHLDKKTRQTKLKEWDRTGQIDRIMPELTIAKSLNKAYRRISIDKQSFDTFKQQFGMLFEQIATIDTKETQVGFDGFSQTYFLWDVSAELKCIS